MDFLKANLVVLLLSFSLFQTSNAQVLEQISMDKLYPWCIVAYDTLERSPEERIGLLKELGFKKYAYDWRDRHLVDTEKELQLAVENNIEVISVWLWLNAKRDSIGKLSPANEQLFEIVKKEKLETTFWVSLSGNFFQDLSNEESLDFAVEMVAFISKKASKIGCKVALYNHSGWFGNPYNEIRIINSLPKNQLSMVYNFHHGKSHIDTFQQLVKDMKPHLTAVNLNGMEKSGDKIYPLGKGSYEKEMIATLQKSGFNGPWGILGHVEGVDVQQILEQNLEGLNKLQE